VFPFALGCMGMSGMYGPADEGESIATIHAALDRGITLLDTGDFYGAGHNELLIGRALRDRRDQALLSVKFGALRGPDGSWLGVDTRPAAIKNFLTYTLTRLGVDHVGSAVDFTYKPPFKFTGRIDNVTIELK
jgi:aryl-alcohol dehydrogenase-like predicted oxidoreductase